LKLKDRDEVRQGQAELKVEDDLSPYRGKWVALRDGHVVAGDLNPILLRARPEVRDSDVFVPIPESQGGYFVA
jgi:hypothetical protein